MAVFGVGLIGGSFSAALRRAGKVGKVIGVGRNAATLEQARSLGLIDQVMPAGEAAASADLIMLSTPVGAMPALLAEIAPRLRSHTLITDGGSTKQDVVQAAREGLGAERIRHFVPGHPIAGSDQSGPGAAQADLYEGRNVILTPLRENRAEDVALVRTAWEACGATVSQMPAEQHDAVLASVSHLPHFLAFAYMAQVAAASDADVRLDNAGSGFRDFSRIAGSSSEMWRDIFLANRDAVLHELRQVQAVQDRMAEALSSGDGAALQAVLEAAADARKRWGGH
nr:prephenate dehydrogenase/arogenate dehydrogenase family protein [Pseudomonas sp.]